MSEPYPTALYHAVHTGNPGDVDFYRSVCREAEAVLELGCGTGRVGRALVRDGLDVVGVDVDAAALSVAAEQGIATHSADMRDFELDRSFDRVIIPYNGLYYLTTDTDVVRCFERVAAHLRAGGVLAFDGYGMDGWYDGGETPRPGPETSQLVGPVEVEGRRFAVTETSDWCPLTRMVYASYRYSAQDGGPDVEASIPHRFLLSSQLSGLLASAGLKMLSLEGGFRGEPFHVLSAHLVVRAEHAGDGGPMMAR